MKATICLRDFNILSNTVDLLMKDANIRDPMNSVTIEYEPHPGGYRLFVTTNECIRGVLGTFRTEIVGDD